jgi:NDP-sugar pyrophosphorylase family protein
MLQIVILAGGRGTRFFGSQYNSPKPLIQWHGKNMIHHVFDNFESANANIYLLCREEHNIKLDKCFIKNLDYYTEGPAISASLFENNLDLEEELIITNCDQIIKDWNQESFLSFSRNFDGVLGCFISNKEHNSYVKLGDNNLVVDVKEKEVISNLATNGLHYWKKAKYFFESLKEMVKNDDRKNGEFYIAPSYNYLIKNKHRIGIFMFNQHYPIGTPEQLSIYLNNENK